jgi:hypothetical protein
VIWIPAIPAGTTGLNTLVFEDEHWSEEKTKKPTTWGDPFI